MLLALDVGNTNITIGVFKRKEIIEVFRITTKLPRTSDEFGILISSLLKEKGLDEGEVKAAIIGSVVPNIMHSLSSKRYLGIRIRDSENIYKKQGEIQKHVSG